MDKDEKIRLARYIMTTGKSIHDRIMGLHSPQFDSGERQRMLKDLSISQIRTIMSVYKNGPISMTELSRQLRVSPPSSSAMVDRLVEKGILERVHSQSDRRKVKVHVNPAFQKDIKKIEESILLKFVDLIEKIGYPTTIQWCEVLEKVNSVLEEEN